ncbi:MAG: MFS transporter [Bacteroidales bacterium]|nr:MFS transporter [Bacteroidales bacterium]
MSKENKNGKIIAIITMMFLYAMISFVTNLAAPIGNVWKAQPGIDGSNTLGMMGNMMNFLAYLFMGIPAGKMLLKRGYKNTALIAIVVGFVGIGVQFLSGQLNLGTIGSVPAAFFVYLLGAFIAGFCVCMLNTVVNPMLNTIGGGGNKGNQLNMVGGSLNSLAGTITPMFVGALIGEVSKNTALADVNPVLFIAMGVFAAAFIILFFIPIANPDNTDASTVYEHSPWSFRHFVLGTIAIFIYVGVEVGIPGTLNFFLSDKVNGAGSMFENAAAIAGFVTGTYWFMMLIGRLIGSSISGKVSSKVLLTVVSCAGIALILTAMFLPKEITTKMPVFTGSSFGIIDVPLFAMLFVLCGLCTSVMWTSIFNLAVEGLGKYTALASGIFMMMVVGGGVLPLIQNFIADKAGYMVSYIVPVLGLSYLLFYALAGHKNVNKDIPVE